jgi:hypothetical protein
VDEEQTALQSLNGRFGKLSEEDCGVTDNAIRSHRLSRQLKIIFQFNTDSIKRKLSGQSAEVDCKFYSKEPNWPICISCFGGCHNGGRMEPPGLISLSGSF